MSTKFVQLTYLKSGNSTQQKAYTELINGDFWERLKPFDPCLCGTIPLGIDIPGSDLDIVCEARDLDEMIVYLKELLQEKQQFSIKRKSIRKLDCLIAKFQGIFFPIEIFAQPIPIRQQHAFRHMVIEDLILKEEGEGFRKKIIQLKEAGLKTEPAFAQLLGLKGDPYLALLNYGEENFGL